MYVKYSKTKEELETNNKVLQTIQNKTYFRYTLERYSLKYM